MTEPLRVVAVSGSLHNPSKTDVLIDEILRQLGDELPVASHVIRMTDVGPQFAGVLNRSCLRIHAFMAKTGRMFGLLRSRSPKPSRNGYARCASPSACLTRAAISRPTNLRGLATYSDVDTAQYTPQPFWQSLRTK